MRIIVILLLALTSLLLSACGGTEADEPAVAPAGPALLVFYTDN